jgi:hypothetical protein
VFSFTLTKATLFTAPYCIKANTFGNHNDLCVSGGHAIKDTRSVWQMPQRLVATNPNVTQFGVGKPITYYHIECPNYFTDNLVAEGIVVESFKNKQSSYNVYKWDENLNGYTRKNKDSLMMPNNRNVYVVDFPIRIKNNTMHENVVLERKPTLLITPKNHAVHVTEVPHRVTGIKKKKSKVVHNSIQHECIRDELPNEPPTKTEPSFLSPNTHTVHVAEVPHRTISVRKNKVIPTFGLF